MSYNHFAIQVSTGHGQWDHVQTIRYDPHQHDKLKERRGGSITYNRDGARKQAQRSLTAWRASDQFIDRDLRIFEARS